MLDVESRQSENDLRLNINSIYMFGSAQANLHVYLECDSH